MVLADYNGLEEKKYYVTVLRNTWVYDFYGILDLISLSKNVN